MDFDTLSQTWPDLPGTFAARYAELVNNPPSPIEEFRDDGSRAVRNLFVEWDQRQTAVFAILGYPKIETSAGGVQYISRTLPHRHPEWKNSSGDYFLFATQIMRIDGVGVPHPDPTIRMRSGSDVARYKLARLQVLYETLTYEIRRDDQVEIDGVPDESTLQRYITPLPQPSAQFLPLPLDMLRYVTAGTPAVPGTPPHIVPEYDFALTWHRVPRAAVGCKLINPDAPSFPLDDSLGCVNSEDFPSGSASPMKPGTMLLVGVCIRPIRSALGDRLFDLEYRFKVFNPGDDGAGDPIGHNYLLQVDRAATPPVRYLEVTIDGTTNLVLQADGASVHNWRPFKKLFQVPA